MESIYKIDTGCDHVAKFRGDRPRELGDLAAKKKLNGQGKARREAVLVSVCGPKFITSPAKVW